MLFRFIVYDRINEKYMQTGRAWHGDEVTMPPELRKAHQQNDKAVMQAYGFWGSVKTESDCVARLMEMYAGMVG